jgi:hypothetical protein
MQVVLRSAASHMFKADTSALTALCLGEPGRCVTSPHCPWQKSYFLKARVSRLSLCFTNGRGREQAHFRRIEHSQAFAALPAQLTSVHYRPHVLAKQKTHGDGRAVADILSAQCPRK